MGATITMPHDEQTTSALNALLEKHGLTVESRLYRYTLPEYVSETATGLTISANPDPSEAVIDVYGQGHVTLAAQIGPGLAFAFARDNQWDEEDRVEVDVRVQDVIDQGGLLYPVESIITEPTFYATLPSGSVAVRRTE
jgi:hypothetical protein